MKKSEQNEYYKTPVTHKTFNLFINNITNALTNKKSATFNFKPGLGGARSWISAILNPKSELNITKFLNNNNYNYCVISYEAIIPSDNRITNSLLTHINYTLFNRTLQLPPTALLSKIQSELKLMLESQNILFIIPKLNEFEQYINDIDSILYSLYKLDKSKIKFLITTELQNYDSIVEQLKYLSEPYLENVFEYDTFDNKDIIYSAKHWFNIYNYKYSKKDLDTVIELANGSLAKSKQICTLLSSSKNISKEQIINQLNFNNENELDLINDELYINKTINVKSELSVTDYSILIKLFNNKNKLITRDQIAEIIWGKDNFVDYSDYAIDKHISDIRKYLKDKNVKNIIKTKRGYGYILI